ncbi:glycosyltransferase family 9 protein [Cyclobacteriaceae bacterium]|nr:glycosyltransferase family 9 protein [Cyclobacteriaceae bacterium]
MRPNRILIIQTAFIGDVVLAMPLIAQMRLFSPKVAIDFLVRKGNESLLAEDARIQNILIWDKKEKIKNLIKLIREVRKVNYDVIINVQRFYSMGLLTLLAHAKVKIGFDKNPFSWSFDYAIAHSLTDQVHEVDRNLELLKPFGTLAKLKPKLQVSRATFASIEKYKATPYITVAPASVWKTKQFPVHKWIAFVEAIESQLTIYIIGGPDDKKLGNEIQQQTHSGVVNLCGTLNLLQSAALMEGALMNYMNDSAPMHLASAMNAPTTAIFCSTIPAFGFGPLADDRTVIENSQKLTCRPCGIHGSKDCPEKHFDCAEKIPVKSLLARLP